MVFGLASRIEYTGREQCFNRVFGDEYSRRKDSKRSELVIL